ncbi:MAG TPA: TonB-dependent receptor [Pseudomonadales bacterium]
MIKRTSLLPLAIAIASISAQAADNPQLESVVILGSKSQAHQLPGSADLIDEQQIEIEIATDINQLLKTVPGIYIREEDGAGLRPNIGIRSATAERSSKITLMEDGVLAAPAPYSNPAAYYFPTMMRMSAIEILKGAPLLRYGPQTTGGVVNLVTTAIPKENSGKLTFITDERGSQDTHAHYGVRHGQWGLLVETVQRDGAGFKEIDYSNRDSGFHISDYLVKLGWESASGPEQSLVLKLQYSEETSNETYLGLTDADFAADPYRRYALSSIDQMENDHTGYQLTHRIALASNARLTTTLYRNEFTRNWFKLSGGSALINDANNGDSDAINILHGLLNVTDLQYKHNDRDYLSQGVQFNVDLSAGSHQLAIGLRVHEDEMDRYQPVDIYDQLNGSLVYRGTNLPTGGDNLIDGADAISLWLTDEWQATEALTVMLALRYEDVESWQTRYADPARASVASKRSNDTAEWLPGVSMSYRINEQWQILAGAHRGFSPLGGSATENQQPETSINWEAGARFTGQRWFAEAIGFYSDFADQAENCSVGSPCSDGSTSGTFVTGEAVIAGLEMQLGTAFSGGAFTFPLDASYTWTQAEISKDNATSGVSEGDILKDVPEHTFSLRAGIEHASRWNNYLVAKYIDKMCISIGCDMGNKLETTESVFVVDLISRYGVTDNAELFVKVENLLDSERIVSRTPDGARPNKPQTVSAGISLTF